MKKAWITIGIIFVLNLILLFLTGYIFSTWHPPSSCTGFICTADGYNDIHFLFVPSIWSFIFLTGFILIFAMYTFLRYIWIKLKSKNLSDQ